MSPQAVVVIFEVIFAFYFYSSNDRKYKGRKTERKRHVTKVTSQISTRDIKCYTSSIPISPGRPILGCFGQVSGQISRVSFH